jgi:hypothetical protein
MKFVVDEYSSTRTSFAACKLSAAESKRSSMRRSIPLLLKYGLQFQIQARESADNFQELMPGLQEFQIAVLIFQILQSRTRCRL